MSNPIHKSGVFYLHWVVESIGRRLALEARIMRVRVPSTQLKFFEFNMKYREFWVDFQIDMEDIETPDPWTSELCVDDFFDKVLFKNIYQKLNIYPFMIDLCKNIIDENMDNLKAYNLNWDT